MNSVADPGPRQRDIAIIGISCRFPGEVSDPAKFWDLLQGLTPTNINGSKHNEKQDTRPGGQFSETDVASFDASFFNITAETARNLNPATRLLLELTYEAIENAGVTVDDLAGSNTGCFVSCANRDYDTINSLTLQSFEPSDSENRLSPVSSQISKFYGLRGPSLTLRVDGYSGLVGLHLACQSLRTEESSLAMVCGANLSLDGNQANSLSELPVLTQRPTSTSPASEVEGPSTEEGVVVVILKLVRDALRDGDPIRIIIRASGINYAGQSCGVDPPEHDALEELIRSTYRSAGLRLSQTTFYEGNHNCDPYTDSGERAAVSKIFQNGRKHDSRLLVGSVQSDVGLLKGVSGLAGIIKCILMSEHGVLIPTTQSQVDKSDMAKATARWPSNSLRRVSLNDSGADGSNVHLVLDDATEYLTAMGLQEASSLSQWVSPTASLARLFIFSARDASTLERMKHRYSAFLREYLSTAHSKFRVQESSFLDQLAFTLGERRSTFDWKFQVVASSVEDLQQQLVASNTHASIESIKPRISFVFSGQGAQWGTLHYGLLNYLVFKTSLQKADSYFQERLGCEWSVMGELEQELQDDIVQPTKVSQSMSVILQIALVDLVMSWNIIPARVIGLTSGEIAAAYTIGAISREDAWTIAYWRAKACSDLEPGDYSRSKGSMIVVGMSRTTAQEYIAQKGQNLTIVAVNSPSSVIISGDEDAIERSEVELTAESIFCRKLKMLTAYTSHDTEPVEQRYLGMLSAIRPKATKPSRNISMVSTVTASTIAAAELGPDYWAQNLVSPARFTEAMGSLLVTPADAQMGENGSEIIFEIGRHAALKGALRKILRDHSTANFTYRSVTSHGEDVVRTMVECAGSLYAQGLPISVEEVNNLQDNLRPRTDLPVYPWKHERIDLPEQRSIKHPEMKAVGRNDNPVSPDSRDSEFQVRWKKTVHMQDQPWVRDHVVCGTVVYPAGSIVALVLEAVGHIIADTEQEIEKIHLKDVDFQEPIVMTDGDKPDDIEFFLHARKQTSGGAGDGTTDWWEFIGSTRLKDQRGEDKVFVLIRIQYKSQSTKPRTLETDQIKTAFKEKYQEAEDQCTRSVAPKDFYEATRRTGLMYGPSFQGLVEIGTAPNRSCCVVNLPEEEKQRITGEEENLRIAPTLIDVILQTAVAAATVGGGSTETLPHQAMIPTSFDSIIVETSALSSPTATFHSICSARTGGPLEMHADISVSDEHCEQPRLQIKGVRFRQFPVTPSSPESHVEDQVPVGLSVWKPDIHLCQEQDLERYLRPAAGAGTLEGKVHVLVDLIAHKTPDLSVLQLGGSLAMTTGLMSVLVTHPGENALFSKLVLADTDPSQAEEFENAFPDHSHEMRFTLLDENLDLQGQAERLGQFDMIITEARFSNNKQKVRFFHDIQALLRNGGVFLLLESFDDLSQLSDWKTCVIHVGLWPIGLFHESGTETESISPGTALCVSAKPNPEGAKPKKKSVETTYVIHPPQPSGRAFAISREVVLRLTNWSVRVQLVPWPPNAAELKNKPIISLLDLEKSLLSDMSASDLELLKTILVQSPSCLWVSAGNEPILATAKAYLSRIHSGKPGLKIRYLLLDGAAGRELEALAGVITKVAQAGTEEKEIIEIDGHLCIERWLPDNGLGRMTKNQKQIVPERMLLEGSRTVLKLSAETSEPEKPIHFETDTGLEGDLGLGEVEIVTKALTISPDSLTATSLKEFSGIVKNVGRDCSRIKPGYRVYACQQAPFRTIYRVKERHCQQIPADKTYEEAAVCSITLATAFHSLVRLANLRYGQTVLIQAATSPVGQAALQIAQAQVAVIFATVESEEGRAVVEKYGIPKARILSDADPDFEIVVDVLTDGKGFDVVLNTSGQISTLQSLWHCVAPFGHFVTTECTDSHKVLDMGPFQKGCSFAVVDLYNILQENPPAMAEIANGLSEYLKQHRLSFAHPIKTFSCAQVDDAFKFVHDSRTQALLTFSQQDSLPIHPEARRPLKLRKSATYLLAGDLEGMGLGLSQLLIGHGASNLVFLAKPGSELREVQSFVEEIKGQWVEAKLYPCRIWDEAALRHVIEQCSKELPPIRGVVHSIELRKDSTYRRATYRQFRGEIVPEITSSWLLHKLLPKEMEFFVMVSSIKCIDGHHNHGIYASLAASQSALARYRRAQDLRAVALDIGHVPRANDAEKAAGSPTAPKQFEDVRLTNVHSLTAMKAAMVGTYGHSTLPAQLVLGSPIFNTVDRPAAADASFEEDRRFSFFNKVNRRRRRQRSDAEATTKPISASPQRSAEKRASLEEVLGVISQELNSVAASKQQKARDDDIDANQAW